MKRKPAAYFCTVVVVVLIGVFVFNHTTRAGYESAEYKVIETDGKFEIREYPDLILVSTASQIAAENSGKETADGSFMKLFRYISGANQSKQKISMTTPVFMEKNKTEARMGFVVPKNVAVAGTPQPTGEGITIRKRTGGRFAVVRFSGRLNEKVAKEKKAKLLDWMKTKNLTAAEVEPETPDSTIPDSTDIETASYDPPFTPGPFRRNEVLIRLQ